MIEEWREPPGYEGIFEVSSLGNIRSIRRTLSVSGRNASGPFSCKRSCGGQLLSPATTRLGYKQVCYDRKSIFVHRLVALAFLDNPESKPFINHKNGVRTDNRVSNIEWCTHSENLRHAYRELGVINPYTGKFSKNHPKSKPVTAISLKTGAIHAFDCALDAVRSGVGKDSGQISRACSGKAKQHNGYIWAQV